MKMKIAGLFFLILNCQLVVATPAKIVIIRHGEKIDDGSADLSQQGCYRALVLPPFFSQFKDIQAIYAQQAKKAGGSIRPLETMAPTAKKLGLKINNRFLRDDVQGVANEILNSPLYQGKTVLISWEHSAILSLVPALGFKLPNQLGFWPGSVFDQAWVLTYDVQNNNKVSLQIIAEKVLPTDVQDSQSGVSNWGREESGLAVVGGTLPKAAIDACASGNKSLDDLVRQNAMWPVPGL